MKEIGGYFEVEKLHSDKGEYHRNCVALNTARNALVYLVRAKNIKKIHIPYFLCDVIPLICEREGLAYEYYHTDEKFRPIFNNSLENNEYLYIVNYYGQLSNDNFQKMKTQYGNIIVDNTHAFFQKPVEGVDTIYSCRKFFGVPDGAYLFADCLLNEELEIDNSDSRTGHLYGRAQDGATVHYEEFKKNDESFKQLPLRQMSDLTHKMLEVVDYAGIKQIREQNYKVLEKALGLSNTLDLIMPVCPFAYPFYCKNGIEIKRKLALKNIYVATLWPNVLEFTGMLEKDYAENILPLPCDQRYTEEDMKIVIDEVLKNKECYPCVYHSGKSGAG